MKRPKIKIEKTNQDLVVEAITFVLLILLIGIPLYHFGELPDRVPRHFGPSGEVDGWGPKWMVLLLPAIGLGLWVFLRYLILRPHTFNYPTEVTEENAGRLYRSGTKLLRFLNLFVCTIFAYISYKTVTIAMEVEGGLGAYFTPISISIVIGLCFWAFLQMKDNK